MKLKQKMIEDKKKKEQLAQIQAQQPDQNEKKDDDEGDKNIDDWEDEPETGAKFDEQIDAAKLLKDESPSICPSEPTAAMDVVKTPKDDDKDSDSVLSSD